MLGNVMFGNLMLGNPKCANGMFAILRLMPLATSGRKVPQEGPVPRQTLGTTQGPSLKKKECGEIVRRLVEKTKIGIEGVN